jgi:hypothetical protein
MFLVFTLQSANNAIIEKAKTSPLTKEEIQSLTIAELNILIDNRTKNPTDGKILTRKEWISLTAENRNQLSENQKSSIIELLIPNPTTRVNNTSGAAPAARNERSNRY